LVIPVAIIITSASWSLCSDSELLSSSLSPPLLLLLLLLLLLGDPDPDPFPSLQLLPLLLPLLPAA
jgi:hypothetical protein